MNTRLWSGILIAVFILILGLTWALFAIPAPTKSPLTPPISSEQAATTTAPVSTSSLGARVVVTSPMSGATVPKSFTVTGTAPGPWYFEASFPIKVVDANNNFIGQGIAEAQTDWMVVGDVSFIAAVTTTGYSGSATLVLMRDNPSGMPENDDSISIPIVIQ